MNNTDWWGDNWVGAGWMPALQWTAKQAQLFLAELRKDPKWVLYRTWLLEQARSGQKSPLHILMQWGDIRKLGLIIPTQTKSDGYYTINGTKYVFDYKIHDSYHYKYIANGTL